VLIGGLEFDDASPQFPVASDILRVDSLYSLPSVDRVDGTIRRGTGKTSIGCGNSSGVDELPGLFYSPPSLVECERCFRRDCDCYNDYYSLLATGGTGAYASRYT